MKIRNGFVSNSSSSSFIIKGFLVPKSSLTFEDKLNIMNKFGFDYKEYEEDINEEDIDNIFYYEFRDHISKDIEVLNDAEDGAPDDDTLVVGESLFDCEDFLPSMVIDTEITPTLQKIKEAFDIDGSVKIICGERCC